MRNRFAAKGFVGVASSLALLAGSMAVVVRIVTMPLALVEVQPISMLQMPAN